MAGQVLWRDMYISSPSPYSIEKIRNFSYPYPVNVEILQQNRNEFRQYHESGYICQVSMRHELNLRKKTDISNSKHQNTFF